MDLFRQALDKRIVSDAPLAVRMRPRTFEEFEEQGGIVGQGTPLRRAIELIAAPDFYVRRYRQTTGQLLLQV